MPAILIEIKDDSSIASGSNNTESVADRPHSPAMVDTFRARDSKAKPGTTASNAKVSQPNGSMISTPAIIRPNHSMRLAAGPSGLLAEKVPPAVTQTTCLKNYKLHIIKNRSGFLSTAGSGGLCVRH